MGISKQRIKKVGRQIAADLLNEDELVEAYKLVGEWRAAHIQPLHESLAMLERLCNHDPSTILVSRLKRIDTIIRKLKRDDYHFELSTLNDIAGCRLIVSDNNKAQSIAMQLMKTKYFYKQIDYISKPKDSGYRGIHIICRHDSPDYGYEGLRVEVQIRSRLQHYWATAVETYDLISEANLKFGSGSTDQKRYFQLSSELINNSIENESVARNELRMLDKQLQVLDKLGAAVNSMYVMYDARKQISRTDSCLISVDLDEQLIKLDIYDSENEIRAASKYTELEGDQTNKIYLMARAGSLNDLCLAYPNYYSNISEFVSLLKGILL
ncbi:RelA/SpoT domain-containing protein [Collinsella sp. zg1085]|uniref:RelA/SpoT domain-containing protein n=1 Tax=Collinsella sp. zg1085 TaxID=2844380 RepID=UPI001C0DDD3B|nr:RelA/SpoT domain-containing protein [Collinsella sp. zg1085]QWT17265.1 RelA/SpoT domain-containing protein [Collinsella sp. zg1085]